MKYILLLIIFFSKCALSVQCTNSRDPGQVVDFDLSASFNAAENTLNSVVNVSKSFSYNVYAICPKNNSDYSWRSYVTTQPIERVQDNFQFIRLNDYLIGGMRITDSFAGQFFPPVSFKQMGKHPNIKKGTEFPVRDTNYLFRMIVTKPFIGSIPIESKVMFYIYVNTTNGSTGEGFGEPVYKITYSGNVDAPQTCEIGTGSVEIDFGKIGAHFFQNAGIGNKPAGANAITKQFSLACKNIDAQAYLTLRLEASSTSGDMVVSDNPDLGFKISDTNNKVITPNDPTSVIPFQLDENAEASLSIRAWPVSVTGNTPSEGVFTARTYLRVDFD